ncbi:MAG: membrane protein insertion efficiency factor YidD [Granulosicoccus sp.]|nr:membrane protein insertion efficiency factor YidD [Granulosicoccus sp.]
MRWLIVKLIHGYKWLISPLIGQNCRFHPSCANYCAGAVESHGVIKGLFLGIKRVFKCQPWHGGGYDPVPAKFRWFGNAHEPGKKEDDAGAAP